MKYQRLLLKHKRPLQLAALGLLGLLLTVNLVKDFGRARTQASSAKPLIEASVAPSVAPSVTPSQAKPADTGSTVPFGASVNRQLVIQTVRIDSLAAKAGLKAGDRLTQVNGQPLYSPNQLRAVLQKRPKQIIFTVSHKASKPTQIIVTFYAKANARAAAAAGQ